jgi:hypothetical protein
MTTHHGRVRNRDDFVLMVLIRVTNKDFRLHRLLHPNFYSVPNFKQAHVRQYQTGNNIRK